MPSRLTRPGDYQQNEIELIRDDEACADGRCGILYEDSFVLLVRDAVKFPSGKLGYYVRVIEQAELRGTAGTIVTFESARGSKDEGIGEVKFVKLSDLDIFLREYVKCGLSLSAIMLSRLFQKIP